MFSDLRLPVAGHLGVPGAEGVLLLDAKAAGPRARALDIFHSGGSTW